MYQPCFMINQYQQTGIALIAVLLFLILITIAGAIAVRQGVVDLHVATSDQANLLLLNNADGVLAHIEQSAGDAKSSGYQAITSQQYGVLGYFMIPGQSKIGHQLTFCYRPNEVRLYDRNQAGIWLPKERIMQQSGNHSTCDPIEAEHYSSGRYTVMTQLSIKGIEDPLLDNFEHRETGTSADIKIDPYSPQVKITSVSLIPAMAQVGNRAIKDCLAKPAGYAGDYGLQKDMSECLKENAIPAQTLIEDAIIKTKETGGFNIDKGTVDDPCKKSSSGALVVDSSCPDYKPS